MDKTEIEARLRRFQRLGGVQLSKLDPAERQIVEANILIGLQPMKRTVLTFICPICGNTVRNDQEMEPACTGPTWLNEHALEPMIRVPE